MNLQKVQKDSRWILLCCLLSFYLCGCAKKEIFRPSVVFNGTVLAKGIEKQGAIAVPTQSTREFTPHDEQIVALLNFEGLSGKYRLKWEWYAPDGRLYYATKELLVEIPDGQYMETVTPWHRLTLKGDPAQQMPGTWEVKIYLNGEMLDARTFEVRLASDFGPQTGDVDAGTPQDNWALIIGIEESPYMKRVKYARNDTMMVKDYFKKVLGVPEKNTIVLLDGDATKTGIADTLTRFLPANVTEKSTLYVYFIGNGAPDAATGKLYLVPYLGKSENIDQTGYPLDRFYDNIEKLGAQRSYIFIDSCFNGHAARHVPENPDENQPVLLSSETIESRNPSIILLSASSTGQTSLAHPDVRHGLFTYYLLKAFDGLADVDGDHWLTINELYGYVSGNVTKISREMGLEQTPMITPPLSKMKNVGMIRIGEIAVMGVE